MTDLLIMLLLENFLRDDTGEGSASSLVSIIIFNVFLSMLLSIIHVSYLHTGKGGSSNFVTQYPIQSKHYIVA